MLAALFPVQHMAGQPTFHRCPLGVGLHQLYEVDAIIISVLWMGTLRHSEFKWLVQVTQLVNDRAETGM